MIAFLFPGQGSQRPGMGLPWSEHPAWRLVDRASEIVGQDVGHLLLDADAEELRATANAQLAMFVIDLLAHEAVRADGLEPHQCAGHSLGEYAALVAAGALTYEDGLRLVAARGAAMAGAAAAAPGAMAAVLGLDDAEVDAVCRRAGTVVANENAPGHVVVAGTTDAVDLASADARRSGAKAVVPLPVAGAFHSPLMSPARAALGEALRTTPFASADVDVVANLDAAPHRDAAGWPARLEEQLCATVRWADSLRRLAADGTTTFVELGPGRVLTGLVRRTVPGAAAWSVAGADDLEALDERRHGASR